MHGKFSCMNLLHIIYTCRTFCVCLNLDFWRILLSIILEMYAQLIYVRCRLPIMYTPFQFTALIIPSGTDSKDNLTSRFKSMLHVSPLL